jgi:hypothetical protein
MLDGCSGVNPGFKDEMEKACCVCDVAGGEARDDSVTLNGCCCPVALFGITVFPLVTLLLGKVL